MKMRTNLVMACHTMYTLDATVEGIVFSAWLLENVKFVTHTHKKINVS